MINLLAILFGLTLSCATSTGKVSAPGEPVSHDLWNDLLQQHVNDDGFVNYKGFIEDSLMLNQYLQLLASSHPQDTWSREEQMAYWINAYNAFTVKLIVDHYPVPSIKDIKRGIPFVNTVWDIKFIHLQDQTYDLNNIEHGILRKYYDDARIHAAVNCASYSCPRLRNEAFVAKRLEEQLDDAMRSFINDPLRNRVSADKAELSQIFSWFSGDFKQDARSIREYINRYADEKLSENGKITYIDYDWRLNDAE